MEDAAAIRNCGNGGECPGIPIESKFRFDWKERLGRHESRADVSGGEGYQMSGGGISVTLAESSNLMSTSGPT